MSRDRINWSVKDDRLLQLRAQGVPFADIAKILGHSRNAVTRRWQVLQARTSVRSEGWEPSSDLIRIRKACGAAFGISDALVTSRSRYREIAHARQATAFVLRRVRPKLSYPCIGQMLGGIDHTTVIHAVRVTEERMRREPEMADRIAGLVAMFSGRSDVRQQDAHVVLWRELQRQGELARLAAAHSMAERRERAASAETEARAQSDDEFEAAFDPARRYCGQCDRSATAREADRCQARLCKAKGPVPRERLAA